MRNILMTAWVFWAMIAFAPSAEAAYPFNVDNAAIYENNGSVGIGTAAPSALFTVGNGTMVATSAGNVGIGTANPASPLDVYSGSTLYLTMGSTSTWTPTLTCDSGSLTTYSSTGYYLRIGHSVNYQITTTLTNIGSCSGIRTSLPSGHVLAASCVLPGREDALTGDMAHMHGYAGQTAFRLLQFYNGSSTMANGYVFYFSGNCLIQ